MFLARGLVSRKLEARGEELERAARALSLEQVGELSAATCWKVHHWHLKWCSSGTPTHPTARGGEEGDSDKPMLFALEQHKRG